MEAKDIVLDGLERIRSIVQRSLNGVTLEDAHRQPRPATNSIAWLAWHLTRVQDNGIAGLFDQGQAWISQGWHATFGMDPDPENEGFGHTPEQVAAFRVAAVQTLLDYHNAVSERSKAFVSAMTPGAFDRTLNEPQYQPLPTVGVRLVSILSDNLQHAGQMAYIRGFWQGRGWQSF